MATPVTGNTGAPKRDIDIEHLLIWTFLDQQAGRWGGHWSARSVSTDGVVAMQRYDELGCFVDGAGGGASVHADAATVYETVMRHGSKTIWDCACTGRRPDWREGARFRFEPRYDDVVKRRGHLIYDRHRHVIGTWVIARDHPDEVAMARTRYAEWHADLVSLAESLHDVLNEYRPWPPGAPARPWELSPKRVLPCQIWRSS